MPVPVAKGARIAAAASVFATWVVLLHGATLTDASAVAEKEGPRVQYGMGEFEQDGVTVISGQTFVVLSHGCITCDVVNPGANPSICTISNTTLPRQLDDSWGVNHRERARLDNGALPGGEHRHTDVLLVPFTGLTWSMKNLYHALNPETRNVIVGAYHFRPTMVAFRQNIPYDRSPTNPSRREDGRPTLVEKLMAMAVGDAKWLTRLNGTVCARRLVLQTLNYTKAQTMAMHASRAKSAAGRTPNRADIPVRALHELMASRPTVVILQRRSSRFILNCDALIKAMHTLTAHASVISMEDHDLPTQLRLMRGVTTLIGAHGAGLAWSHLIRADALVVELSPFPCIHHNAPGGHAGHHSTFRNAANYELVPSIEGSLSLHCAGRPKGAPQADPTAFNVTTNITTVVDIVRRLDPVISTRAGTVVTGV
jgi:hypothetical protein